MIPLRRKTEDEKEVVVFKMGATYPSGLFTPEVAQ